MRKILLPTDYSENADRAIEYAFRLFDRLQEQKAEFILIHSYPLPATMPVYGQIPPTGMAPPFEEERKRLDTHLKGWRERFPKKAIRSVLMGGPLLNALSSVILDEDIDLVVMGTKGASGVEEVLMGSNAARAANNLDCPVLIIPAATDVQLPERIVFATDFQRLDNFAVLQPLQLIVRSLKAHLVTLHVISEGETLNSDKLKMEQELDNFFRDTPHSHQFMEGDDPVESIQAFLNAEKADWLVLLGKQRNFFESLFHKSIVKKMAFHSKIPLLVLH